MSNPTLIPRRAHQISKDSPKLTLQKTKKSHSLLPLILSPPLAMAGRLLPLLLLLLLHTSPAPVRASLPREVAAEDSQRCPRLEDGLPAFAVALRRTCRVSVEGYPAEEVSLSPSSILLRCGDGLGAKIRSFGVVAG